ncbi:hypothetical protein [Paracidobacterium acidisoli]|uniref:O-antigen ligase domain-containing protein n=1 Tax=Paracidobacterium acidisoli TaxID=2303751 RepID=A0A372IK37_9BACT|nr:hypothetical protein [Paracidobacterium acidisoli]MBT9332598.1 hypothetical protein [Paracidobacterium acidisoli]
MNVLPLCILLAWIPVSVLLYYRFPVRTATLLVFVGGWAILPAAAYEPSTNSFPYWILGTSLATNYFVTKASVIGLGGLTGFLLSHRHDIREFRLTYWDFPMVIWCVVPLLSAIANPGVPFSSGLKYELYQMLAWGVPYMLGRLYFSDTESLRLAAQAFVIAALFYIPICIFEIWKGPQLYAHLYGYEPYRWTGAQRYFGYRPIGFLETGNQLGIWMATAALIAIWLWAKKIMTHVLGMPIAVVALSLFVVTLCCQSGASIVLLLVLLPFVFVSHRTFPRAMAVFLVTGVLLFAGLRLSNVVSVQTLVRRNPAAHSVAHFLKRIGRGSLGWRLVEDERHVGIALEKPLLGYGEWDWWRRSVLRPWGLWLLSFGMYGMFGLVALEALQFAPVIRVVWFPLARSDIEALNLRHALAAAILMSAVDNLLNSSMILPLLLVMGGMSTWESAAAKVEVNVEGPEIETRPLLLEEPERGFREHPGQEAMPRHTEELSGSVRLIDGK